MLCHAGSGLREIRRRSFRTERWLVFSPSRVAWAKPYRIRQVGSANRKQDGRVQYGLHLTDVITSGRPHGRERTQHNPKPLSAACPAASASFSHAQQPAHLQPNQAANAINQPTTRSPRPATTGQSGCGKPIPNRSQREFAAPLSRGSMRPNGSATCRMSLSAPVPVGRVPLVSHPDPGQLFTSSGERTRRTHQGRSPSTGPECRVPAGGRRVCARGCAARTRTTGFPRH
jgi:hypothetical protein